ncbi:MAG: exonuclease SbcCD subunit D [Thermoanaerobaculales bacterium]
MTRSVRFVHASDLHLDASFGGVDASEDRIAAALVRSTFDALDRVVDLCIERKVDFLVIAGDLYNSAERSLRAELEFQKSMRLLEDAGIEAFVVHGNHDPADGWSAGLEMPDSVIVFGSASVERHEVVRDGEVRCVVYGRSFPTGRVTENLARGFSRSPEDPLAVAVLHANVGQREGRDNYAPCTVDDLRAAGMDYWALGHIHRSEQVSDQPRAVYSGCTQGLDPSEEGPRGCFVVELGADGVREEFVETAAIRWRNIDVDVTALAGIEEVREAVAAACGQVRGESGDRPVIVRCDLTGRSAAHSDLARGVVLADFLEVVRGEQLELTPWIWVDRIRDRTRPALELEEVLEEEGLRGDLVRLTAALVADDGAAAAELVEKAMAPLLDQLAASPELDATPQEIVERARDLCLDLLSGEAK